MTATYFESTVKYEKVNEDGKAKKVTELYLIDAMSFSETEERSCRQLSEIVQGDYLIQSLKRSKITEYIESNDENDDRLYKATVKITDSDNFGKEKESSIHYLVAASNINRALDNLEKSLSTFVIPYEIVKNRRYEVCRSDPLHTGRQRTHTGQFKTTTITLKL